MTLTHVKQLSVKSPKTLIAVSGIALSLIVTPIVFACAATVSASAQCDRSGNAEIALSYRNDEVSRVVDVIATDQQTQISLDLGKINPKDTKTGDIVTGRSQLNAGSVIFKIISDGGETKQADYSATGTCQGPTPTPTQAPTPTPTAMPSPTATPTPMPTSTPVPTTPPTNNNTNNNNNQNNQNQNVTQNSNPTINITNTNNPNLSNNNTITIQNNPTVATQAAFIVAPAVQTKSLPSTGPETDVLFGLLSMIPAGLGIRKFANPKK